MPPSDPRRPARGRGPARGQVAAWSVLPAAAVVIIVGGLFWASVWIVFRTPTTRAVAPTEPSELIASSDPIDADVWPIDDDAFASDDDEAITDDVEGRVVPDESADEFVVRGPGSADEQAYLDVVAEARAQWAAATAEARAQRAADADLYGYGDDDGEAIAYDPAYDPAYEGDDLLAGPIYGPPTPDGFWDGVDAAGAIASADDEGYITVGEITARAAELTNRTLELTAKAEELTARIEGLTSRMEDLQTRIEISAVPSPVPSPAPTLAQAPAQRQAPRSSAAETVTVRSNVQNVQAPPPSGRAPWVILPQPAPGSRVPAGSVTLEARARGEAPISQIRIQLDGVAVQVAMDRRDDTTWRGRASAQVRPGSHTVAVFVVDEKGRTGSYRWEFVAGP
jgi:hypothetical protein